MQWCTELGIDPSTVCPLVFWSYLPSYLEAVANEQDSVLFCLATDLGSKATGEWEKEPFVQGWAAMPGEWVPPSILGSVRNADHDVVWIRLKGWRMLYLDWDGNWIPTRSTSRKCICTLLILPKRQELGLWLSILVSPICPTLHFYLSCLLRPWCATQDKTDIQHSTYGTSTSPQHSKVDHQHYHVYHPLYLPILPQRQTHPNSQNSISTYGLNSRKRRVRPLVKILGVCLWISSGVSMGSLRSMMILVCPRSLFDIYWSWWVAAWPSTIDDFVDHVRAQK